MEIKNHSSARSAAKLPRETMEDSTISSSSCFQRRLDPAPSPPNSSSKVSYSPKKNGPHSSPRKTSKLMIQKASEPVFENGKKRGKVFCDEQSGADNGSRDIGAKKAPCYNHFDSLCRDSEMKLGTVSDDALVEMAEERGVECSMCGDVGIAELLFFCSRCYLRPQHTYCGRYYPNVCADASICNWCLHEQDSSAAKHPVEEAQCNPEFFTDEALVKTVGPHGKAFDYLLLVAAQSGLQHVTSRATEETQQIKQTASMINITGTKIVTSSHRKAAWDSNKIAKTALTESHRSVGNQGKTSNEYRERSMTGLVEKLNMQIQNAANMKVEATRICDHGGVLCAGESMPKRQRCSKGADAPVLKCRKRGLQLSPARPNYRRYKLLADVVC